MNSTDLNNCTLWWSGPEWLKEGSNILFEATIVSQNTNQENESQITKPYQIDEQQFLSYGKVL